MDSFPHWPTSVALYCHSRPARSTVVHHRIMRPCISVRWDPQTAVVPPEIIMRTIAVSLTLLPTLAAASVSTFLLAHLSGHRPLFSRCQTHKRAACARRRDRRALVTDYLQSTLSAASAVRSYSRSNDAGKPRMGNLKRKCGSEERIAENETIGESIQLCSFGSRRRRDQG